MVTRNRFALRLPGYPFGGGFCGLDGIVRRVNTG
jgi:hypothetical protein